ncbi:unnamed protein product [Allacma fusca]|uniref:Chitin-binding type-2 domain-containing protein n=1 Tax=Allacma fusca TaxID=39272 RepID=A0A8J2LB54_9HEXA|nr:unnamed protein product [Allacma fusca]
MARREVCLLLLTLVSISSDVVQAVPRKYVYRGPDAREGVSCPDSKQNGQFSHPKYCDKYLNCWEGDMVIGQCPSGLVFNEKNGACDYPSNVNCSGREDSRPTMPGNTLCPRPSGTFGSPTNCSEFIVCQGGIGSVYSCPPGLYYSNDQGICTYKEDANCQEFEYPSDTPIQSSSASPSMPQPESTESSNVSQPPSQFPVEGDKPKPSLEPTTEASESSSLPNRPPPPPVPIITTPKPRPTLNPENVSPVMTTSSSRPPASSTAGPDSIDQVLWPAWPNWPTMKCPIIQGMLPVVGDCEAVVVCLGGIGHFFRCPVGHAFDLTTGRCGPIRITQGCPNFFPEEDTDPSKRTQANAITRKLLNGPVRYVYLPLSHAQLHQEGNNLNYKK